MQKEIQFGVDYYPEHWERERWETDFKMMKELGMDLVRLAEFSWSLLEPADGVFAFDWLEEAVDLAQRYGIKVVLGTPTAAPPAWMIGQHPEIQPVDREGHTHYFGGRHHDCQSNPVYRSYIRRYVTAFAERFGRHENVIGWQVDNELGNSHGNLCYCASCEANFQRWLEEKYGTIEALNANWGTAFWSQGYQDFSQIQAPKITASGDNPSQVLDWKLCHSDLIKDFHDQQAAIIRSYSPDRFITHNLMGFSDVVDYYDLAEELDFVSHDQYPTGHFHGEQNVFVGDRHAAELDVIRGIKQQSFWIMEQQSSITGWEILGRAPKPGQISLWSIQSVAHGADAIVYFRWRSCRMGTEQYWHGILPHSGIPGRAYREIGEFIAQVKPLMKEINGAVPKAKVAIVYSYPQNYAFQIQPHHPELRYVEHLKTYYNALYRLNVPVDFIREDRDFGEYELVIAPLQYLMSPALEARYRKYVAKGGQLVLTMRTGVKEPNNLCQIDGALPGGLADIVGAEIHEYDCLLQTEGSVSWGQEVFAAAKWADLITPLTAEPLAVYASEFYAGTPAIVKNRFGKGNVYYVGTEMSPALADRFVQELPTVTAEAQVTPAGVEIAYRETADTRYCFVMNHNDEACEVSLPENWQLYPDNQKETASPLAAHGFKVYRETK